MRARTVSALIALAALVITLPPHAFAATTPPAGIMTTIRGVLSDTNANNISRVDSYYTADAVVVDEFAPYVWTGAHAGSQWWTGVMNQNKTAHVTNMKASAEPVRASNVTGDKAYVVVPLTITFGYKGKPQKETGTITCTFVRSGSAWKISTQTWSTASSTL